MTVGKTRSPSVWRLQSQHQWDARKRDPSRTGVLRVLTWVVHSVKLDKMKACLVCLMMLAAKGADKPIPVVLPKDGNGVSRDVRVRRDQTEIFFLSLCYQHPIKRIGMMLGQGGRAVRVLVENG